MSVSRPDGRRAQLLVGVALAFGMSFLFPALVALLVPTLLGLLLVTALARYVQRDESEVNRRRILMWTGLSFGAHLMFSLFITNMGGTVSDVLRAPDSITYNLRAIDLTMHWTQGLPKPLLPAGKEGYYYLLAGLYWVFGAHAVAGLAVNAALSAALVPLVTDTTRSLFGSKAGNYAAPLVVLLPGMFLWSSQLGKEAPALFLVAMAANSGVRLIKRGTIGALLGITISIALLFSFRGWVALVLAGGFLAGLALGRRRLLSGVGAGVSTAAAMVVLVLTSGIGYSGYQAAVSSDLKEANAVRQELALTGRTGYDQEVDVSTGVAALSYLPVGLVRLVLGPFPWQLRGVRQLPAVLEVLVWWALLPSLWRGLRRGRAMVGRQLAVILLPALTTAILLSLSIGNYGTQLRERLQVIVLLVPLVALGLAVRAERRTSRVDVLPTHDQGPQLASVHEMLPAVRRR